jgi:hypothetical protein
MASRRNHRLETTKIQRRHEEQHMGAFFALAGVSDRLARVLKSSGDVPIFPTVAAARDRAWID